ncbi:MAG: gliding motility lipoprotein GldD [Flavobacteriales bacterium]|nr:gliding motility lipoprotein GldD [Flavobacteriales bacterium]
MKRKCLISLLFALFLSCKQPNLPKQHGYPFIEFPDREYALWEVQQVPYSFLKPSYTMMQSAGDEKYWYDLNFIPFNATLHLSYKEYRGDLELDTLMMDTRKLAYKHTIKATEINDRLINDSNGRMGMIYELEGETATSLNFFITDNKSKFVRGALYFNAYTTIDSVGPIVKFIKKDIDMMIHSFRFREP